MNKMKEIRKFSIISLTVKKDRGYAAPGSISMANTHIKNLEEGTYYFTQSDNGSSPFVREYFGENITIQAIVGKNGSGKSTILDLVIKVINNFSYCLYGDEPKDNALEEQFPLRFVRGIFAELAFVKEGIMGKIICSDNTLEYHYGQINNIWVVPQRGKNLSKEQKIKISNSFFYSLVVNYSIHSFNEEVYQRDFCYGGESSYPWIKALFHKNDGYRIPLNINPFRSASAINMIHENQLNDSRLEAILIASEKTQQQFLPGYKLSDINYYFNPDHLLDKFSFADLPPGVLSENMAQEPDVRREAILNCFRNALKSKNSYAFRILEYYGYKGYSDRIEDDLTVLCYLYIVYKVLNIIATYPSYRIELEKKALSKPSVSWEKRIMKMAFSTEEYVLKNRIWDRMQEEKTLERLAKDASHITLKIRQVRNFLKNYKPSSIVTDGLTKSGPIDYMTYYAYLRVPYKSMDLDTLMSWLPPALFSPSILLDKYVEEIDPNGKRRLVMQNNRPIEIRSLSSGELQYIHTLSTIIYHVKNIQSINSPDRESYNCINLMMDEIEMCFHPDYQRTLVSNLLFSIKSLGLNKKCGINIIMATHSPFILSDIPKENILYLEEGKDVSKSIKFSPFAANVNDTLHQSFFMKNGFLGSYVSERIRTLCDFLTRSQTQTGWSEEKAELFISEVGDPLLKQQLWALYMKKRFGNDKRAELAWLKDKVRELEKRNAED